MMNSTTFLVVPCFNEANRLKLDEFNAFLRSNTANLIFVNDGSTDETKQLLSHFEQTHPGRVTVLHMNGNCGKAESVRKGLLFSIERGASTVGYLDADLSTPLQEMIRLLEILRDQENVHAVLASRIQYLGTTIQRNMLRHYLGRFFATYAGEAIGLPVYDTQCGAKVFRVTPEFEGFLKFPFRTQWLFDIEIIGHLIVSHRNTAVILEMPLRNWKDIPHSKISPRHFPRLIRDLVLLWVLLAPCRTLLKRRSSTDEESKRAA